MQEVYLVLTGITAGALFTATGITLGIYLMRKAYSLFTEPPNFIFETENTEDNSRGLPSEAGAYDWDSYDAYVKGAEEDEKVPEA